MLAASCEGWDKPKEVLYAEVAKKIPVQRMGTPMDIAAADWDRLFAIDVRGAMLCCREAARRMAGRGGSIVVIATHDPQTRASCTRVLDLAARVAA